MKLLKSFKNIRFTHNTDCANYVDENGRDWYELRDSLKPGCPVIQVDPKTNEIITIVLDDPSRMAILITKSNINDTVHVYQFDEFPIEHELEIYNKKYYFNGKKLTIKSIKPKQRSKENILDDLERLKEELLGLSE